MLFGEGIPPLSSVRPEAHESSAASLRDESRDDDGAEALRRAVTMGGLLGSPMIPCGPSRCPPLMVLEGESEHGCGMQLGEIDMRSLQPMPICMSNAPEASLDCTCHQAELNLPGKRDGEGHLC